MALTANKNVPERGTEWSGLHEPNSGLAANAIAYQGSLCVFDAAGNVAVGTTALNLNAIGVSQQFVDNTGGAAGDLTCEIRSGIFLFDNSGGDPIAQADLGAQCFIEDDETVSRTDGGGAQSAAGTVYEIDATGGVWVAIGFPI